MSSDNTCPCNKYAHFTANQSILDAFTGKTKVHVIDFSIKKGDQWPSLLQALAIRPGGPPTFRLTSIGSPSGDSTDHLQEVGSKLAQLADTIHIQFEYKSIVVAESLADLEPGMLGLKEGEVVAINSVFDLHQLLARPGAVEKVFTVVKEMKPEVFTVVETCGNVGASNIGMGMHTCNVVGCEGLGHQSSLTQWKTRIEAGGFEPFHLGSNAHKQASMLLKLFCNGGDGYRVEENEGCLMLCWYTWPLIMTSAWKP